MPAQSTDDFQLCEYLTSLTPGQKNALDKYAEVIEREGHPYLTLLLAGMLFYADDESYIARGGVDELFQVKDSPVVIDSQRAPVARAVLDRIWPGWKRVLTL